jgi:hypothetical protein
MATNEKQIFKTVADLKAFNNAILDQFIKARDRGEAGDERQISISITTIEAREVVTKGWR